MYPHGPKLLSPAKQRREQLLEKQRREIEGCPRRPCRFVLLFMAKELRELHHERL